MEQAETEPQVEVIPPSDPSLVTVLPDGKKVKIRQPRMRACSERKTDGKTCLGHLKRWYYNSPDLQRLYGANAEIYRCERCHTVYLPNPEEVPRTGTLAY